MDTGDYEFVTTEYGVLETLPWINYKEVFDKIEERGRVEGRAEGRAEGRMEVVMELLKRGDLAKNIAMLESLGFTDDFIRSAREQVEAELAACNFSEQDEQ